MFNLFRLGQKKQNFEKNSFDIVTFFGNKVECFFDKVECCFDIVAGVDKVLVGSSASSRKFPWVPRCIGIQSRPDPCPQKNKRKTNALTLLTGRQILPVKPDLIISKRFPLLNRATW